MSRISILTPFRNAERFILETANSILAQIHHDWEWILVNDHSEENEEELLIEKFQDPRIRCYPNNGKGIIDALRTAFDQVSGEFVTRMDADDTMPDFKLALMLQELQQTEATIVTGKVRYFSMDTDISAGYQAYENWLNQRVDHDDFYAHIYRECTVASANWLMRTSDLKTCGGFDNLTYPEDYDLLFRWYKAGFHIKGIHEVTHLWRDHDLRTSKTSDDYQQKAFFKLKIKRFVELEFKNDGPLIINGTGQKGRITAKYLLEWKIPFFWISHEATKFPNGIFNHPILGIDEIPIAEKAQVLNTTLLSEKSLVEFYSKHIATLHFYQL